jgi:hypothetical protein
MSDWTARFRGIKGEPLVPSRVTKYFRNQKPYSGKEPFTDEEFPPNIGSLFSERSCWDTSHRAQVQNMGEWTYKRCSELLGSNFCVYDNQVNQGDVKQGQLGDCYLLAAFAALTEFPGLIEQNFKLGGKKSENGYYEILMFIDEEWQIVILDDYIPCLAQNNWPSFCQPTRNVIWMLLLEKAWAKVNDGWSNIIAGKSVWPMHLITGFPCSMHYFQHYNQEDLWKMITYSDSRNDIMTCSAFKTGNGIYASHQYTLRFAGEIKDNNGNVVRLVCIRNPWGRCEWQGDWSDNSSLWTPQLRKQLGVENRDDGVFYMTFNDFLYYYDCFEVAHSPNYYKNSSLFSHSDSAPKVYNLLVENITTLTVNIFSDSEFRCSVFLCRYDPNYQLLQNHEASYLCSYSPFDGRIYNISKPGNYVIAIYPHENKNFNVRFSSNGEHIVRPDYHSDKNFAFLTQIKSSGICEVYHKLIKDTDICNFINSLEDQYCDIGQFCQGYDCNSIKGQCCSEYKDLCSTNCTDAMICLNSNLARFKGDVSKEDNFISNNNGFTSLIENFTEPQSNTNFQPQITEDNSPTVFENSKLLTRERKLNYNYLTVNFPNKEIHKVELEVTMRDQGWCDSDCSGSWIDLVLYNQNGDEVKRETIFKNLAVPTFTTYSVVIDPNHEYWPYMNMHYRMNLIARSDWGWEMWIKNAKCVIS